MGGTPGILPFALRISLRLLNFVPDKIVHGPIRSPGIHAGAYRRSIIQTGVLQAHEFSHNAGYKPNAKW
ncbi:MAG: hypothetical protein LRY72_01185 [Saccharospirillaceae bacterium]|nr:hypothetical protein [Saccharospirillaceae bacterium]